MNAYGGKVNPRSGRPYGEMGLLWLEAATGEPTDAQALAFLRGVTYALLVVSDSLIKIQAVDNRK